MNALETLLKMLADLSAAEQVDILKTTLRNLYDEAEGGAMVDSDDVEEFLRSAMGL